MIDVKDLTVSYGAIQAVRGVSLTLEPASIVSIVGNNGAGKSSTLRGICGLVRPRGGSVTIDGTRATGVSADTVARMGLRFVPEGGGIFPSMSVQDNLLTGLPGLRTRRRELARAYDRFPVLAERRTQLAGYLSGGERQMLALSLALMAEPRYLLLDEPSLGLAPLIVSELFRTLDDLRQEGIGILLVEQNATRALELADHAYVMESGSIDLEGSGEALRADPRVVDRYLGVAASATPAPESGE